MPPQAPGFASAPAANRPGQPCHWDERYGLTPACGFPLKGVANWRESHFTVGVTGAAPFKPAANSVDFLTKGLDKRLTMRHGATSTTNHQPRAMMNLHGIPATKPDAPQPASTSPILLRLAKG